MPISSDLSAIHLKWPTGVIAQASPPVEKKIFLWLAVAAMALVFMGGQAAADDKPSSLLIVSDAHGYGDIGAYGKGEGRGMPTPNLDRKAADGMPFLSFYAQPSSTPDRAAMQNGRIPNCSGMTAVAFRGQGSGLSAWPCGPG
jgi:hypothetical protein